MNDTLAFRSTSERQKAEKRALAGDAEAARALATEALYVENNREKAIYWYRIGASHGDGISKKNLKTLRETYQPTI